jgi:hypothetical protein
LPIDFGKKSSQAEFGEVGLRDNLVLPD